MRHTHYPGAAALLAVACLSVCAASTTGLEYVPLPWHNTSSNCTADPAVKRVYGPTVMRWGGRDYLVGASQLNPWKAELRATGLGPLSWARLGVPAYGDRDINLFNITVCDDCRYGAAGFDVQGLVVWDWGTGTGPLWGPSHRYVDSGTAGALTFVYGGRQYLIARLSPACQGDALVEVTGVEQADMRLVECVYNGAGQPYVIDGGFWLPRDPAPGDPVTGHVWLLDRQLGERVHTYTVTTVNGDPHLTAIGWVFRAGWLLAPGVAVDQEHGVAVSAYSDGLSVWSLDDPAAPTRLSLTPLWPGARMWGVSLRWPYVWAGVTNSIDPQVTFLLDITRPEAPVMLDPGYWALSHPWNTYPCAGNGGAAWYGDTLYLARKSVGLRHDLNIEIVDPPLFVDGFESGTTAAWTAAQP